MQTLSKARAHVRRRFAGAPVDTLSIAEAQALCREGEAATTSANRRLDQSISDLEALVRKSQKLIAGGCGHCRK